MLWTSQLGCPRRGAVGWSQKRLSDQGASSSANEVPVRAVRLSTPVRFGSWISARTKAASSLAKWSIAQRTRSQPSRRRSSRQIVTGPAARAVVASQVLVDPVEVVEHDEGCAFALRPGRPYLAVEARPITGVAVLGVAEDDLCPELLGETRGRFLEPALLQRRRIRAIRLAKLTICFTSWITEARIVQCQSSGVFGELLPPVGTIA